MSFYELQGPSAWADPPSMWSTTSLDDAEACPRRWQLLRSRWGDFERFPARPHPAAIEGQIVHEALDRLTRACGQRGCLELQGAITETSTSDQQRGPAVACVDTSGSMQGAPEAMAKAMILAVVRQLAPQRRPVQLLLFGGPGESNALELRAGRGGLDGLLRFLSMGFHSGTDYDTPLLRAAELLTTDTYRKADVLVVTDGLCRASARIVGKVTEAKKTANARILSVVIGHDTAGVEDFSDDVWLLKPDARIEGGFDLAHWRRHHT